jgi:hypothetical protein
VHAVNAALSRLHSNVLPASVEVKLKIALVLLVVAGGAEVIVVSAGMLSMIQVKLAGV